MAISSSHVGHCVAATRYRFDLRDETARCQLAVVESPEGPFHLVHWHLGLAERERHWQVRHLLDHSRFHESAHLPTLIVGDFNDWLNTLARGPFAAHDFVQVTTPRSRFRSFPAYWPVASLDKAFAGVRCRSATHISCTRGWHATPPTTFRSSLISICIAAPEHEGHDLRDRRSCSATETTLPYSRRRPSGGIR